MIRGFLFLTLLGASLLAQITPAVYFEIEIKAQQMTIEGQEKRLACMQAGCSMQEQYNIDGEYQTKIFNMYSQYGTSPSKMAAYYTHHDKEVDAFLENDEALQFQMDQLNETFEMISEEIRALVEAQ